MQAISEKIIFLLNMAQKFYETGVKNASLDQIDLIILDTLQSAGRTSNVDLAKKVGISAPPCLRRVRRLEEMGAIRGYHANISPDILGYPVTAFTHVGLISQAEVDLAAFERLTQSWPEVRECHMLMGEDDFLLKVVARTVDHYNTFITQQLTPAPNIKHVKSALAIRPSFTKPGVPVDDD